MLMFHFVFFCQVEGGGGLGDLGPTFVSSNLLETKNILKGGIGVSDRNITCFIFICHFHFALSPTFMFMFLKFCSRAGKELPCIEAIKELAH